MAKIHTCDYCVVRIGEMACSNSIGGSYCSVRCADIAEVEAEGSNPKSTDDIIANLARRVAELERNEEKHREVIERMGVEISNGERICSELFGDISGAKRDIETWAQEVEVLRYANEELYSRLGHVEKDIDDNATLNTPKQITLDVKVLERLIGVDVRG